MNESSYQNTSITFYTISSHIKLLASCMFTYLIDAECMLWGWVHLPHLK